MATQPVAFRDAAEISRYAHNRDAARGSHRELVVTNGLILLGFIAVVLALLVARVKRRIGMRVTVGTLTMTAAVIAIAILALWATNTH